jgi:chorismate mutase
MDQITLLRKEIDIIDDNIIKLLNERVMISKNIGKIKKYNNINIICSNRENEIIDRLASNSYILPKNDILLIYNNIFNISKTYQLLENN